ncbi:hypothetical protein PAPYR_10760 [Paratrimastix pyriformis]|uniref:Uncharacterized protein n=1 Tax=Paratrimastix pyriformis TaxID=342808 RepID=A0ABQ8U564_9EUKA|nr:hypothetical protein PAPYR_10760 [Paratrimastix pyriformis]
MSDTFFSFWNLDKILSSTKQLGVSACGATALCNTLDALGISQPLDKGVFISAVKTRLRRPDAPLVDYLLSRCEAGTTHADLIAGLSAIAPQATARFFPLHAETFLKEYLPSSISLPPLFSQPEALQALLTPGTLSRWLMYWMRERQCVPILTINPQEGDPRADAWHHQMACRVTITPGRATLSVLTCTLLHTLACLIQMACGVTITPGMEAILLTNPVEALPLAQAIPMVASPPVLRIRTIDVLRRCPRCPTSGRPVVPVPLEFPELPLRTQPRPLPSPPPPADGEPPTDETPAVQLPHPRPISLSPVTKSETTNSDADPSERLPAQRWVDLGVPDAITALVDMAQSIDASALHLSDESQQEQESETPVPEGMPTHIAIPCRYRAGVTLVTVSPDSAEMLRKAPHPFVEWASQCAGLVCDLAMGVSMRVSSTSEL